MTYTPHTTPHHYTVQYIQYHIYIPPTDYHKYVHHVTQTPRYTIHALYTYTPHSHHTPDYLYITYTHTYYHPSTQIPYHTHTSHTMCTRYTHTMHTHHTIYIHNTPEHTQRGTFPDLKRLPGSCHLTLSCLCLRKLALVGRRCLVATQPMRIPSPFLPINCGK